MSENGDDEIVNSNLASEKSVLPNEQSKEVSDQDSLVSDSIDQLNRDDDDGIEVEQVNTDGAVENSLLFVDEEPVSIDEQSNAEIKYAQVSTKYQTNPGIAGLDPYRSNLAEYLGSISPNLRMIEKKIEERQQDNTDCFIELSDFRIACVWAYQIYGSAVEIIDLDRFEDGSKRSEYEIVNLNFNPNFGSVFGDSTPRVYLINVGRAAASKKEISDLSLGRIRNSIPESAKLILCSSEWKPASLNEVDAAGFTQFLVEEDLVLRSILGQFEHFNSANEFTELKRQINQGAWSNADESFDFGIRNFLSELFSDLENCLEDFHEFSTDKPVEREFHEISQLIDNLVEQPDSIEIVTLYLLGRFKELELSLFEKLHAVLINEISEDLEEDESGPAKQLSDKTLQACGTKTMVGDNGQLQIRFKRRRWAHFVDNKLATELSVFCRNLEAALVRVSPQIVRFTTVREPLVFSVIQRVVHDNLLQTDEGANALCNLFFPVGAAPHSLGYNISLATEMIAAYSRVTGKSEALFPIVSMLLRLATNRDHDKTVEIWGLIWTLILNRTEEKDFHSTFESVVENLHQRRVVKVAFLGFERAHIANSSISMAKVLTALQSSIIYSISRSAETRTAFLLRMFDVLLLTAFDNRNLVDEYAKLPRDILTKFRRTTAEFITASFDRPIQKYQSDIWGNLIRGDQFTSSLDIEKAQKHARSEVRGVTLASLSTLVSADPSYKNFQLVHCFSKDRLELKATLDIFAAAPMYGSIARERPESVDIAVLCKVPTLLLLIFLHDRDEQGDLLPDSGSASLFRGSERGRKAGEELARWAKYAFETTVWAGRGFNKSFWGDEEVDEVHLEELLRQRFKDLRMIVPAIRG